MDKFMRKLIGGIPTTEAEWDEHLLESHRRDPGMTPRSFARWKSASGRTSYELLADAVSSEIGNTGTVRILDLACGDGYLIELLSRRLRGRAAFIGVDMSAAELKAADTRLQGKGVELIDGRAQDLPLPDRSVDAVVCHMAFMLMSPVEPVVQEIVRVLRPGGVFAAVVNTAPAVGPAEVEDPVMATSRQQIREFFTREYPAMGKLRAGDSRVGSHEGLRELFNPGTGYRDDPEVRDFDLLIEASPQALTDFWLETYVIGALPAQKREQLRRELLASFIAHQSRDGSLRMLFPMWLILARSLTDGAR